MSVEGIGSGQANMIARMEQMKQLASSGESKASQPTSGASFKSVLADKIQQVNQTQLESSSIRKAYVSGDPNVSVADVLQSSSKSSVAFEALRQTHTKVFEAYKGVLDLQI